MKQTSREHAEQHLTVSNRGKPSGYHLSAVVGLLILILDLDLSVIVMSLPKIPNLAHILRGCGTFISSSGPPILFLCARLGPQKQLHKDTMEQ